MSAYVISEARPKAARRRVRRRTHAVPSDWGPSLTKYRYVYSGNRVMLVDPATRTVVHEVD